jgi:hypothetical protein
MSNQFVIFEEQVVDGDSAEFSISPRDSVGIADTDYSAYFEIFGDLGGGVLTLLKKCKDGTFREAENLTNSFNQDLPSAGKCALISMNFKDPTGIFKFNLTGATSPELTITGINMQGA